MEESYRERRENREKAMIDRDGRRWEGKTKETQESGAKRTKRKKGSTTEKRRWRSQF